MELPSAMTSDDIEAAGGDKAAREQIAGVIKRTDTLAETVDAQSNTQSLFLGGAIDDLDSFDEQGGKTGPLGYYPVVNAAGETVYTPCLARINANANAASPAVSLPNLNLNLAFGRS